MRVNVVPPAQLVSMLAVVLGTLLVPLDSAVNIDFPWIIARFRLAIPEIQWLVISYTLSTASLMLIAGRVADMLGYRRVFLAGCVCSAVAFVACAIAPAYSWLLAARAIQGMGAGLLLSSGPALITSFYADAKRARALGIYTAALGVGGAIGPPLGALLIARFDWSAVFWFRAPISGLAFVFGLSLPRAAAPAAREQFDLLGAVLLVAATSAALVAMNETRHAGVFAALLIVAIMAARNFLRQERRFPHPIIDLRLFRDRGFAAANFANLLINLAGFAVLLLIPFQLVRLPTLSVTGAGLLLAASPIGLMLGAPAAGRMAAWMTPHGLMLAGSVLVSVGLLGVARFAIDPAPLALAAFVQGTGQSLFQVAYLDLVTGAMPLRERGVAGGLAMLTRTLGLVVGAAVLMLVFQTAQAAAVRYGSMTPAAFLIGLRAALCTAAAIAATAGVASFAIRSRGRARGT
jgi:EmrB/QacA subfamily drug resistance transporter